MVDIRRRTLPQLNVRAGLITILFFVLLLFASGASSSPEPVARKTLRVMTYNIHVGVGMDKKLDLVRIAEVIKKEKPDLVGLQEVDRGVKRTEGRDEIVELAGLTAMQYAFAHNLDYQGGQYGVAVLSRFPIRQIDHRKYENRREAERRGMLRVEIDIGGGRILNFANTHLDYQFDDGRLFEAEQMLQFLAGVKGPLIVVGDFNDEPTGNTYKLMSVGFEDAWLQSKAKGAGLSYPADTTVKRIDYIFSRRSDGIKAKKAWVVNTQASDHIPVVAELEIR